MLKRSLLFTIHGRDATNLYKEKVTKHSRRTRNHKRVETTVQLHSSTPPKRFLQFNSSILLYIVFLFLFLLPTPEASWWFVFQSDSNISTLRSLSQRGPSKTTQGEPRETERDARGFQGVRGIHRRGRGAHRVLCNNIPGLVKRQRLLCQRNSGLMLAVAEGVSLGIQECQFQFQNTPWNCSIFPRDTSVFGGHIRRSTRESSFVHAINNAAVVFAITRACNQGLLSHCRCDSSKKGDHKDKRGEFTWGGCSDNLRFSSSFARRFIDAAEKRQRDVRSRAALHNNRVGRKSVRKNTRLQCKCHGVSGSCSYRTCWVKMSHFREASNWLKRRYEKAIAVIAKPDGSGLLPKGRKRLRKIDLVYMENSPDYCEANAEKGLLGTAGRRCNATSLGSDSCYSLCCGRGFFSQTRITKSQCECKFKWCCQVSCKMCEVWQTNHFCNS